MIAVCVLMLMMCILLIVIILDRPGIVRVAGGSGLHGGGGSYPNDWVTPSPTPTTAPEPGWDGPKGSGSSSPLSPTSSTPTEKGAKDYVIFYHSPPVNGYEIETGWHYHTSNDPKPYLEQCYMGKSKDNLIVWLAQDGMIYEDLAQRLKGKTITFEDAKKYAMNCKWSNGQSINTTTTQVSDRDDNEAEPPASSTVGIYNQTTPGPAFANTSYGDGRRDRLEFEKWVQSLRTQYKDMYDGAQYWAARRSDPKVPICPVGTYEGWTQGCEQAKAKLDPIDKRRKSDADYKAGWNAASSELEQFSNPEPSPQ